MYRYPTKHHTRGLTRRTLRHRLLSVVCYLACLLSAPLMTSCGLIDLGLDEAHPEPAGTMTLRHDTLYVMAGDHFLLQPIFTPDSIANHSVFYQSDNEDIVRMDEDSLLAVSQGWTTLRAISVSSRLVDSCAVCVIDPWLPVSPYAYPHETIIYADVTVDGKQVLPAYDDGVMLVALIAGEVRAVGRHIKAFGHDLTLFRVAGDLPDEDGGTQTIAFAYYHRPTLRYILFPQYVEFDGETHGAPSAPFRISDTEQERE